MKSARLIKHNTYVHSFGRSIESVGQHGSVGVFTQFLNTVLRHLEADCHEIRPRTPYLVTHALCGTG